MDIKNLETASDYINNLLLSRGLLRNGEPISFAHPSQDEGGKQATMTKVINLVHDLILRRDRESEMMAKLSQDVVNLRNTSTQQIQTIHKLESQNAEVERQFVLKCVSEKTATMSLKTVEAKAKVLKEDMVRLKATIGQIRAQCANDIRKKETEIRRLQKHLEPKRGREGSVQVGVTVVNPGATLSGSSVSSQMSKQSSLYQETADHLTHLSRQLSVENQTLRVLVQTAISTLRDLQGIPESNTTDECARDNMVSQFNAVPCAILETEITEILNQLRSLLTNPSFVSLEEVQIREEEIVRLREGWEKMEARWREALSLMHSWRKRMMETGDAINLDDLRKGLVLGSTPITMPPTSVRKGRTSIGQLPSPDDSVVEDQSTSMPLDAQGMDNTIKSSNQQEESVWGRSEKTASPVLENLDARLGAGLFPAPRILRPTAGNARGLPNPSQMHTKRHSDDLGIPQEKPPKSPLKKQRSNQDIPQSDLEEQLPADYESDEAPTDPEDQHQDPPLTIEQKLTQAKREAEQATAALRRTMAATTTTTKPNNPQPKDNKPLKRTKAPTGGGGGGSRAKRTKRRSTLLPEELEGLIGGGGGGGSFM